VPLLLLGPQFFSDYSFWVHHPANWDDQHLLAHTMASDFSIAWQCLPKRTIGFSFWIKLHTQFHKSLHLKIPFNSVYSHVLHFLFINNINKNS
jgi:hypothetical protein